MPRRISKKYSSRPIRSAGPKPAKAPPEAKRANPRAKHGARLEPRGKNRANKTERTEPRAAFSWFPPHMRRTEKKLLLEARRAHLILEVRDARLPLLSANPELERLTAQKPRLILFNKASLADERANRAWEQKFKARGLHVIFGDAEQAQCAARLLERALILTEPMRQAYTARGIRPPEAGVIVLGIPNVGKSTLINRLLHRKRHATGPQPGVTRRSEWAPLRGKLLLLDTPGVLLPRIETDEAALQLAWIGALPQHLLGPERVAQTLLRLLSTTDPESVAAAYGLGLPPPADGADWLPAIAEARYFVLPDRRPDIPRTADQVLRDFREGKLGRITLESAR